MFKKITEDKSINKIIGPRKPVETITLNKKLSHGLWNNEIWELRKSALEKYPAGFKLAINQNSRSVKADIVLGYANSKPEQHAQHDPQNILYKIANETAPFSPHVKSLYQDSDFFALADANPQMTTHILVIAKQDKMHMGELSPVDWQKLYLVIDKILEKNNLKEFRLEMNTKNAQVILQFHLHIMSGKFVPGVKDVYEGAAGYPAY